MMSSHVTYRDFDEQNGRRYTRMNTADEFNPYFEDDNYNYYASRFLEKDLPDFTYVIARQDTAFCNCIDDIHSAPAEAYYITLEVQKRHDDPGNCLCLGEEITTIVDYDASDLLQKEIKLIIRALY